MNQLYLRPISFHFIFGLTAFNSGSDPIFSTKSAINLASNSLYFTVLR